MGEVDAALTDFDPFGGSALADPYPQFAHFVEHQPVFWSAELGYWVVSRYADARRVLREHETFSAANALGADHATVPRRGTSRSPTVASGRSRRSPTSTRRPTPAPAASPRWPSAPSGRRRWSRSCAGVVRRFVEEHRGDGQAEIVSALTWELPGPRALRDPRGAAPPTSPPSSRAQPTGCCSCSAGARRTSQVDIATGMAAFWRYCEALADDRRATPRPDFTSDLVHTPDQAGTPLTQQEVATILFGLLLAGHETTTNLLGNALRRLLEEPARWVAVVADPATIPGAIEEVLRYDSSVVHWRRRTTTAVRLSGVELPEPAPTSWCASAPPTATRACSPEPDVFDLRRANANQHLSFGSGPHLCLGAPLARLEARSCSRSSPPRCPACACGPGRPTTSCRSSGSADRARSTSSGTDGRPDRLPGRRRLLGDREERRWPS